MARRAAAYRLAIMILWRWRAAALLRAIIILRLLIWAALFATAFFLLQKPKKRFTLPHSVVLVFVALFLAAAAALLAAIDLRLFAIAALLRARIMALLLLMMAYLRIAIARCLAA